MSDRPKRTFQNRFQGWGSKIPGYRGYREKDRRRDADRLVREHLSADLSAIAVRLDAAGRTLAGSGKLRETSAVDSAARAIRHTSDKIATAAYGYGGIFGDRPVDERALDQLLTFDDALGAGVSGIDAAARELECANPSVADILALAAEVEREARTLLARFELRRRVIEQGQPASSDEIAPIGSAAPASELSFAPGDIIAIGPRTFVADGGLTIAGQGVDIRLVRMTATPPRWLSVPISADAGITEFVEATGDVPRGTRVEIGGVPFTLRNAGNGVAEATGAVAPAGRQAASFARYDEEGGSMRALIIEFGGPPLTLVGATVDLASVRRVEPAR